MTRDYHNNSAKSSTIQISQTDEEEWTIRLRSSNTSIFHALIEGLKIKVSPGQRDYDPIAKVWRVFDRELLDEWLEFAKGLNANVKWVDEDSSQQSARPGRMSSTDAFKTLYLLPGAPPEIINACHKALALLHHPDRGGDVERMKIINAAHDLLVKGGGAYVQ